MSGRSGFEHIEEMTNEQPAAMVEGGELGERSPNFLKHTLATLVIWIIGQAIADYVFSFGANAWRMWWGGCRSDGDPDCGACDGMGEPRGGGTMHKVDKAPFRARAAETGRLDTGQECGSGKSHQQPG